MRSRWTLRLRRLTRHLHFSLAEGRKPYIYSPLTPSAAACSVAARIAQECVELTE
jgi:hypothetical protein